MENNKNEEKDLSHYLDIEKNEKEQELKNEKQDFKESDFEKILENYVAQYSQNVENNYKPENLNVNENTFNKSDYLLKIKQNEKGFLKGKRESHKFKSIINEKIQKDDNDDIYKKNINFENFDIYNFDLSRSLIISNIDDIHINCDKRKKIKQEKEIPIYKNLEEYVSDNNLMDKITLKKLSVCDRDDIQTIRNFENNFEEIIEEKNKIIEDLKIIINNQRTEFEDFKKITIVSKDELLSRISLLKEKNENLKSGNHEEIISFYEKNIEIISNNYLKFLKKLKDNWDIVTLPNLGGEKENIFRIFQTMKIQINTLFKENEKLTKYLDDIKKSERMNHVYKNVISKFGEQIDINRKVYQNLNKKQSEYVKELEFQKQQLLEALHEEKEKSRIDYQKLEDLSEQMKIYKNFEKEISLTGYLKKIENGKEASNLENNLGITSYLSNFLNKSGSKPNSPKNSMSPIKNLSNQNIYDFINSSSNGNYLPLASTPNFGISNLKNKMYLNKKSSNSKNKENDNIKHKERLESEHNKNIDYLFKNTGINFEKTNRNLKNFYKIVNASKIIFKEKLSDIGKINDFFFEKLDRVDVTLKIRFKRNTEIIKDTINVLQEEFNYLHSQFQKFYIIDESRKLRNYTKFEIYMDKISNITSIQDFK